MNVYIADSMARDHIDTLVAGAVVARRAREAGLARRALRAARHLHG